MITIIVVDVLGEASVSADSPELRKRISEQTQSHMSALWRRVRSVRSEGLWAGGRLAKGPVSSCNPDETVTQIRTENRITKTRESLQAPGTNTEQKQRR